MKKWFTLLTLTIVYPVFGEQIPDLDSISKCKNRKNGGVTVYIDNAHNNYHTKDNRFAPFARLLECNGYQTKDTNSEIDERILADADVLVIANALSQKSNETRKLPALEAFSRKEIKLIKEWVLNGGSLLLIADHMPYPGSVKSLAYQFEFYLYDGFAVYLDNHVGTYRFDFKKSNVTHDIVTGKLTKKPVESFFAFAGSAFRAPESSTNLLKLPRNFKVRFPNEEWEFDASTPEIYAHGLSQGAVRKFGKGRVAVFAEAAMFTAQKSLENGEVIGRVGFNIPEAKENPQFILNLLSWLSSTDE